MSRRSAADLAAMLLGVDLDGSACAGSGREFVDVGPVEGRELVEQFCWRCPVVGRCRTYGDDLAPHAFMSVYGARVYERDEPAEGYYS